MACDEAVTKIPRPSGLPPRQMFNGHAMRAALERTTDEKKRRNLMEQLQLTFPSLVSINLEMTQRLESCPPPKK